MHPCIPSQIPNQPGALIKRLGPDSYDVTFWISGRAYHCPLLRLIGYTAPPEIGQLIGLQANFPGHWNPVALPAL